MRVVVVVVCLFLALWLVHAKIVVVHTYDTVRNGETVRYRTYRTVHCLSNDKEKSSCTDRP